MSFMAKQRAQRHYNAGTRILMHVHQSSYRDKGLEEASQRIDKAISALPKNLKTSEELSEYLGKHLGRASSSIPKDLEKAVNHFRKAVELDPDFAFGFHNLAYALYDTAEYSIAIQQFQLQTQTRIKESVGEDTTIALQRIQQRVQEAEGCILDALESALNAVDRALEIQYEFPQAHNTRGMVLAKMSRLDEALEATEVALSQSPDYDKASENRDRIKELIWKASNNSGLS